MTYIAPKFNPLTTQSTRDIHLAVATLQDGIIFLTLSISDNVMSPRDRDLTLHRVNLILHRAPKLATPLQISQCKNVSTRQIFLQI